MNFSLTRTFASIFTRQRVRTLYVRGLLFLLLSVDLDECATSGGTTPLNDCDDSATCGNLDGYFYCVCNLDFDNNSTEEEFPGRICIGKYIVSTLLTNLRTAQFFFLHNRVHVTELREICPLPAIVLCLTRSDHSTFITFISV